MNCLECRELLQRRLDGEAIGGNDFDRHLAECADCRDAHQAAARLLDGLKMLPEATLPADLSRRITGLVLAEQRHSRFVWRLGYLVSAAAAAVILAYVSGVFTPATDEPRPIANVGPKQKEVEPSPEPAPLAESAEGARNAVASLTEKFAAGTQKQAQTLLAVATPPGLEMPPMPSVPALTEPLDPAAGTLKQATQTVAQGLEPVAKTARRAWNYFIRELPVIR